MNDPGPDSLGEDAKRMAAEARAADAQLMVDLRACAAAVEAGKHYGFRQDIWQRCIDRIELLTPSDKPHEQTVFYWKEHFQILAKVHQRVLDDFERANSMVKRK